MMMAFAGASVARADEGPAVALAFAVVEAEGRAVVDEAWLDAQVAAANALYAAIPLRFVRAGRVRPLDGRLAHIETRAQRDAAMAELLPGAVDVRVAASLMDVDEPGRVRRGVHWHLRRDRRRHYIILSSIASPGVLAHELGHYFGLAHSPVADNLMSYDRTGAPVFLDEAQKAIVREALRRYLRSRELRAVR